MAVSFILRTTKKTGYAPVFARIQTRKTGLNLRLSTHVSVPIQKWNLSRDGVAFNNFKQSEEGVKIFSKLEKIERALNSLLEQDVIITAEQMTGIIDNIAFEEEREVERKKAEEEARKIAEANRMTLNKFIAMYIEQISNGARQTERGLNFAFSTVKSIKSALNQFAYYQEHLGREIDFNDIDMNFYHEYTAYLKGKNYSINSIGKCIKELKTILATAEGEGYHNNPKYKDKKFKGTRVEVDNIYLTKEDLEKIKNVDLSEYEIGHEHVRDIFMVGVWTAQRVSDYNNISRENIKTYVREVIETDENGEKKIVSKEFTRIEIRQQKTGAKVVIPCSSELKAILEKYDYNLPHLEDQVINRYIKDIGKDAGLTEFVEIEKTQGGKAQMKMIEKYKLIHTHTARRTGATLMYLSGMDIYDIMKITGHSSPAMLKKYIKADQLEVASKIEDKYDYFK
ncbi:MAG: phage integrase SAM-like domain-containing protein [Bacteroidales bacterium]|nr:phage integrase SAM-like domain-containing protein [Bacteroidales bacterium]